MKIRILSFLVAFMFSQVSMAEVIECKNEKISLKAMDSSPATTPKTLKGKLKTKFWKKASDVTLKIAPRGDKLNYTDYWNSKNLWLSLGEFHGAGYYPKSTIALNDGKNTITHQVTCSISGNIAFRNYCEKNDLNNPQENLLTAVENKNGDLLNATLACNVDVNIENENGCSPLLVLLDRQCGTAESDPHGVADIRDLVLNLLDAGAMVNAVDPISEETALIKAARIQDLDVAKHLLDSESDIDSQDKDGFTALMRAVETRYLKMVELFVAAGANLDTQNSEGLTALQIAKKNNYRELYAALSGVNTIVIQGSKSGVCTPMQFSLLLNKPNRIILKTENPMLMLDSESLGISLMAASGRGDDTTITPKAQGQFKMSCGPSMGDGNPEGKIVVE